MIQITGYPSLQEGLFYLKKCVSQIEEKGERVIVFCEDRLTLLAEQAVCQALGGSFLTSVTTFARFLRYSGKILSKQGSVMVVGRILAQQAENLKCLSSHSGEKGGAVAVYEMLSQLFASKVSGETLLQNLPEDGLLKDKLSDLALIYNEYERFLIKNGYMDESRYLAMLPQAIQQDMQMPQTSVIFLGFSSFTSQALDGVRAACERAKNVFGILPAGSAEIYTNQAAIAFKKVCQEYGEVKLSQLKIPAEDMRPADVLREKLYAPEVFSPSYTPQANGGAVRTIQTKDEEDELRFVCARIKKHVAQGGRYSSVAVFVPQVQKYVLLLSKVFSEYNVPFFVDLKKSLAAHPFAYFLFSFLRAVADGGTPFSVERIASSCYFADDGQYRNYLLKFCNYRGGYKREIKEKEFLKDYDRDYLVAMRDRLIAGMGVFSRKNKGKAFCQAVRKLYLLFNGSALTQKLVDGCGDDIQKEYLLKMEKVLEEVLLEAEEILGEEYMSVNDFLMLMEEGLKSVEISLLPMQQDEVFVGDISQSRIASAALVFALGMNDCVPFKEEDTALLSDKEMRRLENVRIKIEPSVAQVNDRTRESVALNICSFTQNLYLSYPMQTEEERTESDILRYARRIFCDTAEAEDLFIYACSEPMPALKELLFAKEAYCEGLSDERTKYASLYQALKAQEGVSQRAKTLFEERQPLLFVENGEKLFFSSGEVSPTLLENYYTCPYRNFSAMGLRLKEREETALLLTDAGTFVHAVLEATAKNADSLSNEESCLTFARQAAEKLFQLPKFAFLRDTSSGAYAGARLAEESAQVALQMYLQIKNSNFKVKYIEYDCRLPLANMHGKIDRVDECGEYIRIIDYKTGNTDDSPLSYYVGKKLQLQLYMSAVSEGKTPAGIYYFPASVKFSKEGDVPFRMLGFMNGSEEVIRNSDVHLKEGEKSLYFNASLGKNTADKVMSEEDFRLFIAYSVLSSRQGGKELKKGFIAPTPYADSCRYCAYKGMCAALGDAVERKVTGKITCKEIAAIVKRETEGEV